MKKRIIALLMTGIMVISMQHVEVQKIILRKDLNLQKAKVQKQKIHQKKNLLMIRSQWECPLML